MFIRSQVFKKLKTFNQIQQAKDPLEILSLHISERNIILYTRKIILETIRIYNQNILKATKVEIDLLLIN